MLYDSSIVHHSELTRSSVQSSGVSHLLSLDKRSHSSAIYTVEQVVHMLGILFNAVLALNTKYFPFSGMFPQGLTRVWQSGPASPRYPPGTQLTGCYIIETLCFLTHRYMFGQTPKTALFQLAVPTYTQFQYVHGDLQVLVKKAVVDSSSSRYMTRFPH